MNKFFLDRTDAGQKLARELTEFHGNESIVAAIPRGGVPVGYEVARHLQAGFDLVIPRKLPIPWNPEAGFGAVAAEGAVVLNQRMLEPLGLEEDQIQKIVEEVRSEIRRREEEFHRVYPPTDLTGKTVIIVDDGIASGYTMLAAIESVRRQNPKMIVVAAPVASTSAVTLIQPKVHKLVVLIESHHMPFAVADFYLNWHDLDDREVMEYLQKGLGVGR